MASPAVDNDFQLGTTLGGKQTLRVIGIPNPHPIWRGSVSSVKLGDNSARLLGAPVVEWHWGFLTQAQRDILRTYCPGASALVYITTPTTENVAAVPNAGVAYSGQMIWPAPDVAEDPATGRRLEFKLIIRQLIPT